MKIRLPYGACISIFTVLCGAHIAKCFAFDNSGEKMKKLRRCTACLQYTLGQTHCGKPTKYGHPPPFNIMDRWAAYRRKSSLESA